MKKIYFLLLCMMMSIGLWAKDVVPKTKSSNIMAPIVTVWDMSIPFRNQYIAGKSFIVINLFCTAETNYSWVSSVTGTTGSGTFRAYNGNGTGVVEIPEALLNEKIILTIDPTNVSYIAYGYEGRERLVELRQWGGKSLETMESMFYGCDNMVITTASAPDLSLTKKLTGMFMLNKKFNQDISHWNTSKVEEMNNMFLQADAFNQDISNWDMRNVLTTEGMFSGALKFNQPIKYWYLTRVTNMSNMFNGATEFNQEIPINTYRLTNMSGMFANTRDFKQDISNMYTDEVTDMSYLFQGSRYNESLDKLKIAKVTNMAGMFKENTVFNLPLKWNTSIVTNMSEMFMGATAFNQDFDPLLWNTQNVEDMSKMFAYASIFNKDVVQFNTSKVKNMAAMFSGATLFNKDISTWNVANVENMSNLFNSAKSFNGYLRNWDVRKVKDMSGIFAYASSYNQDLNNWETNALEEMTEAFRAATAFNKSLSNWKIDKVTSLYAVFAGATSFNQDISAWNTEKVFSMAFLFNNATAYNKNIANWKTALVTTMQSMFDGATSFDRDLSNLNVSAVTNLSYMFKDATLFNANIGNWDVSKVTTMEGMFQTAPIFNQNLSRWNVSNVLDMEKMFANATSFNQDLGKWNYHTNVALHDIVYNSGLDCANYSSLLISWANQPQLLRKSIGNYREVGKVYGSNAVPAYNLLTASIESGGRGFNDLVGTAKTTPCYLYEAPALALSEGTTLYTSPTAVVVDTLVTITNLGTVPLKRASLKITQNLNAGDKLSFDNDNPTNYGDISASYDAANGLLSLTSPNGTATQKQWENVFSAVKYNTLVPPVRAVRSVAFQFNDSTAHVLPVVKNIAFSNPEAPKILVPVDSTRTKNQLPTLSGTSEVNGLVSIFMNDVLIGTTSANVLGAWTFTPATNIAEGTYVIKAKVKDALNFESEFSTPVTLFIDITPPAVPVITTVANGATVYTDKPTYTGTAEAGSLIKLYLENALVGTTTTSTEGTWSIAQNTSLTAGQYGISATAEDDLGNVSAPTNLNTFTVDLSPNIHVVGNADSLSTVVGTASESKYIIVSGTYVNNKITAVVSSGFEISLDSLKYSSSVNFGAAGQIAATKIYVRITSRAAVNPTLDGTIVLTSPGANTEVVDILNAKVLSSVLSQEITFNALGNKLATDPIFNLTATASSGLPVSYSSSATDIARIVNGNQVEILKDGVVVITATQAGNAIYSPALAVQQILVVQANASQINSQTITFNALSNKLAPDPIFTLTATASSGLAISYSSSDPTVAKIVNNDQVEILKAGVVVITATQGGNAIYSPAQAVQQMLVIQDDASKINSQTITFNALGNKLATDPIFTLTATASSGLAISYSSSDPAVAKIVNNDQVEILKAGVVVITATQGGNALYSPAQAVQQILIIQGDAGQVNSQIITFNPLENKSLGDAVFNLTATASSGLAISYSSSDPAVAKIVNNNQVEILKAGVVIITANQSGNASYQAAIPVQQMLIINGSSTQGLEQTITFNAIGNKLVGDAAFALTATASSGLAITYTSSVPEIARIINGNQLEILKAGIVMITASQSGNEIYNAALPIQQLLVIDGPSEQKLNQTITFNPLTNRLISDPIFNLTAVSSSGLAVTYTSSAPTVARIINDNQIEILKAGVAVITASQSGNSIYLPATPVQQILVIEGTPAPTVIIRSNKAEEVNKGEVVELTASGALTYVWSTADGIISGLTSDLLVVRPSTTTTYTVTGYDQYGQSSVQTKTVFVVESVKNLQVNNVLSPNGDGVNDTWFVENIDMYPNNKVKVFDVSGKIVFEKNGYDNTWNGTYKGSLLEGTYYYMIDYGTGDAIKKGSLSIFRN